MPICTYFTDHEVVAHRDRLKDKEIRELLDEVNAFPGENWFVAEWTIEVRRLFRKPLTTMRYTLFSHVHETEWQLINFAPEFENWSISTEVQRRDILNFLMGYIGGRHAERRLQPQ